MFNRALAEFFGTMTLTFIVIVSITSGNQGLTPVLAAVTLGCFVYTIGGISGTHINPVVSIGALVLPSDDNKWLTALIYVIAQFIGAFAAYAIAAMLVDELASKLAPTGSDFDPFKAALAEGLGTFIFTFGIATLILGKVAEPMMGIVAAASLLIGIYIGSMGGSSGILNPAVALSLTAFTGVYVVIPIVAGLLGMSFARYIYEGKTN